MTFVEKEYYNRKEGVIRRSYENESGRYAVKVDDVEELLNTKPENSIAQY
jgi:hypothetical protein